MEQLLHCASASVLHTSQKSKVTWSAICLTDGRRCARVGVCEIAGAHREVRGVERGKKRREKVRVGFDTPDTPKLFRTNGRPWTQSGSTHSTTADSPTSNTEVTAIVARREPTDSRASKQASRRR